MARLQNNIAHSIEADSNNAGPSPFTIEELSGRKRKFRFIGRALPYAPLTVSGSMKVEATYYPGNPIATVQILGSQEDTTTINGQWKDRFLGFNARIGTSQFQTLGSPLTIEADGFVETPDTVMEYCKRIDDVRRQGQLLRVTWDEIARQGILTSFKQTWRRRHDVEWEMVFTWQDQGEQPAQIQAQLDPIDQMPQRAEAPLTRLQQILGSALTGLRMLASFVAVMTQKIADLNAAIKAINQIKSMIHTGNVDPALLALRVVAVCDFIRSDVNELLLFIDAHTPHEVVMGPPDDPFAPSAAQEQVHKPFSLDAFVPPAGTIVGIENALRKSSKLLKDVRSAAVSAGIQHKDAVQPAQLLHTHVARKNQDLRDVSRQFYGTPDEWRTIMRENQMTGSRLTAGQLIFVPPRPQSLRTLS